MTDQLQDPTTLPDVERSRRAPAHQGGTDTEHDAAELVTPRAGTLRARVIDQLRRGSSTAGELATALDGYLYSVAPRVSELVRMGWVEDSGERRDTERGAAAIVWRLTGPAIDRVGLVVAAESWSSVDVDLGIDP